MLLQTKSLKFRKRIGQWGTSNRFQRNPKTSALFYWPANYFWQQLSSHAAQLNGLPSINAKKISISKLTVKRGLKNIPFAIKKHPKSETFIYNYSPKKLGGPNFGKI